MSETAYTPDTNVQNGNNTSAFSTAPTRKGRKPLVIALAAALVVMVALVAYIVSLKTSLPNTSADQAATAENQGSAPSGSSSAAAKAYTDPQAIKTLKALQERIDGSPLAEGDVNAPVVMIEFMDFSCPVCAQWAAQTYPALQKYVDEGTLRIEIHPWVIFPNYNSDIPARGLYAAGKQGKTAEFYAAAAPLSAGEHKQWDEAAVLELAKQAGVPDLDQFTADMNSDEARKEIDHSQTIATGIGFRGTPAFVINNRIINGADSAEVFSATIEAAAADVKSGAF